MKDQLNNENKILVSKLWAKKIKIIRKLTKQLKNNHHLYYAKRITEKYFDKGSEAYAKTMRNGYSLERVSESYKHTPSSLFNHEQYQYMIQQLDKKHFETNIDANDFQ